MRKRLAALCRCALADLLLGVCLTAAATQGAFAASSLLHKTAPEFVRTGLNHQRVDLKAYRGKVVLLDFWATWCAPCQVEMPRFAAWQSQYGPRGLQVIGVSMDDDPADALLGELYGGVLGLPLTYLIDSKGVVRAEFQGEADMNVMEKQLQTLLQHP